MTYLDRTGVPQFGWRLKCVHYDFRFMCAERNRNVLDQYERRSERGIPQIFLEVADAMGASGLNNLQIIIEKIRFEYLNTYIKMRLYPNQNANSFVWPLNSKQPVVERRKRCGQGFKQFIFGLNIAQDIVGDSRVH